MHFNTEASYCKDFRGSYLQVVAQDGQQGAGSEESDRKTLKCYIDVPSFLKYTGGLSSVPRWLVTAIHNLFVSFQLAFPIENLNSKAMENKGP